MEELIIQLTEAINRQTAVQEANARRMERLIQLLEREQKPFLEPDEACRVIGIRITKSGRHRSRLKWLRDKGFLTRFGSLNPYTYDSEEVKTLADLYRQGRVAIPSCV